MAHPHALTEDQLRQTIAETLSTDGNVRKTAEERLKLAQVSPGHVLVALRLIASADASDPSVQQAAAVHFKNLVKKAWNAGREDGTEGITISAEDRNVIKTHLVELMCTTPSKIQGQLRESISIVAKTDYPDLWQNLGPELVSRFNSPDLNIVIGVLMTLDSICRAFRYVRRTDDLYKKILYTLLAMQAQLLALLKTTGQAVDAAANDVNALTLRMETLRLLFSIFYSLTYQDLPEFFEDHMAEFMAELAKYLGYNNPILVDADEVEEPGPIDKVQAGVIKILHLFGSKDEECFIETYLQNSITLVWNLLVGLTPHPKHDPLATTSINFLSMLIQRPMHIKIFQEESVLRQFVLNIVVPNLLFREGDMERFEYDPSEYIQTEVEGSDNQSRRKCAQDFLRSMCRNFEAPTTNICSVQVKSMMDEYATDPNAKWAAKDAAIHIMMGIAVRRESPSGGVTELNESVDVMDVFKTQILPELRDNHHTNRPVLKATALKFVGVFRNQFSREDLVQLIPLVIVHLNSPVEVVHTFAAYVLERILVTKEPQENGGRPKIGSAELRESLQSLFTALFTLIDNENLNENAYAMKCVMRALATTGSDVVPVTKTVIEKLSAALIRVAKNPRNPQYNHYLFEAIAVLVKNVCSQDPNATNAFEHLLFGPFTTILQSEVAEFTPYVFQVLSQLLEYRPAGTGLGQSYQDLFVPLLTPTLWENKGNVPALARLLQAYMLKAAPELVPHLNAILGVFQKLVATKSTEVSAFEILDSVIIHFPQEEIASRLDPLLRILLVRLQSSKTDRYVRLVTAFFSIFVGRFGPQSFFDATNAIQAGVGIMLLQQVWSPRLKTDALHSRVEAKMHAVALTRLLCESPVLLADDSGKEAWASALAGLVGVLTSSSLSNAASVVDNGDDTVEIEIGYDGAYSRLVFATKQVEDPFAEIADPRATFVEALRGLLTSQQAVVAPLIQLGVGSDPKLSSGLESMFQQAGVSLT